jgi:hypothetical protein
MAVPCFFSEILLLIFFIHMLSIRDCSDEVGSDSDQCDGGGISPVEKSHGQTDRMLDPDESSFMKDQIRPLIAH